MNNLNYQNMYMLKTVDNISELRNINGQSEGESILLLGYYVPGDKGHLVYKWTFSIGIDNGGSIINSTGGSWIAIFENQQFNSKDFSLFPISTTPNYNNFISQQTLFDKVRNYAIDHNLDLVFDNGNYSVNIFRTGYAINKMKINIIGKGIVNFHLKKNSTPTMVQFWDDAYVENINFYSLETELDSQRATTESRNRIYLKKCGFFNFKNQINGNSWGLYAKNTNDLTVDNCFFGNNGQSDFSIVDNCNNIKIVNPVNIIDNGMYLNIEPNSIEINQNIQLQGGAYRRINLLINTLSANPVQNMTIIGCQIDWLMYDGADCEIIGSQIKKITNQEVVNIPMGNLDMNLRFGPNLIPDPYLIDFDYSESVRSWVFGTATSLVIDRVNKDFTRIGNRNIVNHSTTIKSKLIPVNATSKYLFMLNGNANYFGTISNIARCFRIELYDSNQQLITITKPVAGINTQFQNIVGSAFRFPLATEGSTGFTNQIAILEFEQYAPQTKYLKIELGKYNVNQNEFDFKFISLNEILSFEKGESISSYISRNLPNGRYKITTTPPSNLIENRTTGAMTGDILYSETGQSWIVTDGSIRPIKVDKINKKMINQTGSSAVDIATLVSDFNELLKKLKEAGLMNN